ncbi:MAG: DUF484 family protein [Pseudomonadota bacterium]
MSGPVETDGLAPPAKDPTDVDPTDVDPGGAAEAKAAPARSAAGAVSGPLDGEERTFVRHLILAEPGLVLDDDRVMRALIAATGPLDRNVVDLRDKLVERLEDRLARLTRTNRSVIAAAYENVASTEAVHAAVLALMDAPDLAGLAAILADVLPPKVAIAGARLAVEADVDDIHAADAFGPAGRALLILPRGTVAGYLGAGIEPRQASGAPGTPGDGPLPGPVVLRAASRHADLLFEDTRIASEALMPLDLEGGTGLLALGSHDPERFSPEQGTDLLQFLAAATERLAARHFRAFATGQ